MFFVVVVFVVVDNLFHFQVKTVKIDWQILQISLRIKWFAIYQAKIGRLFQYNESRVPACLEQLRESTQIIADKAVMFDRLNMHLPIAQR